MVPVPPQVESSGDCWLKTLQLENLFAPFFEDDEASLLSCIIDRQAFGRLLMWLVVYEIIFEQQLCNVDAQHAKRLNHPFGSMASSTVETQFWSHSCDACQIDFLRHGYAEQQTCLLEADREIMSRSCGRKERKKRLNQFTRFWQPCRRECESASKHALHLRERLLHTYFKRNRHSQPPKNFLPRRFCGQRRLGNLVQSSWHNAKKISWSKRSAFSALEWSTSSVTWLHPILLQSILHHLPLYSKTGNILLRMAVSQDIFTEQKKQKAGAMIWVTHIRTIPLHFCLTPRTPWNWSSSFRHLPQKCFSLFSSSCSALFKISNQLLSWYYNV